MISSILGLLIMLLFFGCSASGSNPVQSEIQPAAPSTSAWNFDSDQAGKLFASAAVFSGDWAVRAESDTPSSPNALCQTASAEFPAIRLSDSIYTDFVFRARFKPISGQSDQAAGLIFRIQDANNYYILRANALEDNVNLYKYVEGRRSVIKEGSAVVEAGQWQELRVEVAGNDLKGFLNDQLVVEITDDTYASGQVGLWTKADSVTCFDDVEISPT